MSSTHSELIARYDRFFLITADLDPHRDVLAWIEGLRSVGFTADLLHKTHGMLGKDEIRRSAKSIAAHADSAVAFLEQAYSGPRRQAFLPAYYGILNLSKICCIAAGYRAALDAHRYHGASYPAEQTPGDLLRQSVKLHGGGALGVYYTALTGRAWTHSGRVITMRNMYGLIPSCSAEMFVSYKSLVNLIACEISLDGSDEAGYRTRLSIRGAPEFLKQKRYLSQLKVVAGVRQVGANKGFHVGPLVDGDFESARTTLLQKINRCLIQSRSVRGEITTMTPVSNSPMLMPEEIPLWLALFHMSNVTRYAPEYLAELEDSKAWPVLLSLLRYGTFRMMLLTWSFLRKQDVLFT